MSDHQHPAHDLENRRLAITLKAIDEQVGSLRQLGWSGGAVPHAAFQVRMWGWEKSDRLLEVRSSPYFGRIDVEGEAGVPDSFYIGLEGLPNPSGGDRLVIDWRAPIAMAFYRPDERTVLKRRIDIKDSRLVSLADEYVRKGDGKGVVRDTQADPMLHSLLGEARGGALGNIVRTIQAKQDELIRALDSIVVVQGAAGTGKTVVALHRLAYLIYQARSGSREEAVDPEMLYPTSRRRITDRSASELKVAVFGPNRTYLRHIRAVLPSLGERDAVETTFEDWVWGAQSGGDRSAREMGDELEQILDASNSREIRVSLFRRARAKGSVEMAEVLNNDVASELMRYLSTLRSQPLRFVAQVGSRPITFDATLPSIDAPQRLKTGMPLNEIRGLVRERMRQRVREQVSEYLGDAAGSASQYAAALDRFDSAFERRWPRTSFATLYWALLGDASRLEAAAAGVNIQWAWLQSESTDFGLDDVAPLAFLRLLVDGPIPIRPPGDLDTVWTRLDHIVVDEAQDLSPLALVVLRAHADSLTVLGDMNQAIYAHRGTRSWSEVRRALGRELREIRTLSVSYRSTQQICELANHIVRVGGLEGGVSRPFPRAGAEPCLRRMRDQVEMQDQVIAFVNEAASDDTSTVAILTRTAIDAQSWFDSIGERLAASAACIVDRHDAQDARILILPAYLAKGVEFDAVAVVDVDEASYTRTVNDATLLYVAVTRALHSLILVWCGSPSPLIADWVATV